MSEKISLPSDESLTFKTVEDQPLFEPQQAAVLASVAVVSLVSGVLIHARIFLMLSRRRKSGTSCAIDTLYLAHNIVRQMKPFISTNVGNAREA